MVGLGLLAVLTNTWESMQGVLLSITVISVLYFAFLYFFNSRYQIFFEKGVISMQAASLSNSNALTSIRVSDISSIQRETSNLHTTVKLKRPFQRIAIYDKNHNKFIDISLKHFAMEDVHKLMKLIKEERPDLVLPQQWL